MAENSVFSNETGQVLFGSGGHIYKVPYEFQGKFIGKAKIYGELPYENGMTFLRWTYRRFDMSDLFMSRHFIMDSPVQLELSYTETNIGLRSRIFVGGSLRTNAHLNYPFNRYVLNGMIYYSDIDRARAFSGITFSEEETALVGLGFDGGNTYIEIGGIDRAPISDYMIFERALSQNELIHINSNGNGSLPLSMQGMFVFLKLDRAEILPIGGVNKVGVRDYSGNSRHGEIMNLPAGTLQEQLDWANANLFVPFIS